MRLLLCFITTICLCFSLTAQDFPESDLKIAQIKVLPSQVKMMPGEKVNFQFVALDREGKEIPASFSWSFGGGKLEHSGTFTAGNRPGNYTLEATVSTGVKGIAYITIIDPFPGKKKIASLEILPKTVYLKPGEKCAFRFLAKNKAGEKVATPALQMGISGGDMDMQGNYTAGERLGQYTITADTGSGVEAKATIIISNEEKPTADLAKKKVVITPSKVSLKPGEKQKFNFMIYDAFGNSIGESLGISMGGGKMLPDGTYTAGSVPGDYKLRVTLTSGEFGEADIKIISKATQDTTAKETAPTTETNTNNTPAKDQKITRLIVMPSAITLNPGEECKFQFVAMNAAGDRVSPRVSIQFTGGNFQANGTFVAGQKPGQYEIIAKTAEGLQAKAVVLISGQVETQKGPGPLDRVWVSPERVRVEPKGQVKFQFGAVDKDGNSVPANLSWSFRGGRLKPDGSFQVGAYPSQYYVTLKDVDTGKSATAIVAILPEAPAVADKVWILMQPHDIRIKKGQSQQINCTLTDDAGNHLPLSKLTWDHLGGEWNSETQTFTAGDEAGYYYVEAKYSEHVKARVSIIIE